MIEKLAQVYISEAVVIIKARAQAGRPVNNAIRLALADEAKFSAAPLPDKNFGADVQAGIDADQEPVNPPSWD